MYTRNHAKSQPKSASSKLTVHFAMVVLRPVTRARERLARPRFVLFRLFYKLEFPVAHTPLQKEEEEANKKK